MVGDSGVEHFINVTAMEMATVMGPITGMEMVVMAVMGMGVVMAVGMALMGPRTK